MPIVEAAATFDVRIELFASAHESSPGPGAAVATFDVRVGLAAVSTSEAAATFDVEVGFSAAGSANLPAADVAESENPKSYILHVNERRTGANGIIEFDAVRDDPSIYPGSNQSPNLSSASPSGTPAPPPPEEPSADNSRPGSTLAVFLDIPQLRSEDDGPGFHAGASGLSDGWNGALLFEKKGSEFVQIGELAQRAVIGRADTKLLAGDVTLFDSSGRTFVYDETNTVDVTLRDGVSTLASVADADLLAGVNAAAIGRHGRWEIVLFGTATQLSERKWRLSHLLRGMKGTEWAVGLHQAGDQFVLLDGAIRRIKDSLTDLDVERTFRAVSIGNDIDSASSIKFTNTGVSLKPLSPVFIRGEEDAEENRILRAYRRSRIDGLAGRDGLDDPPLGETTERYEIDILNSAGTAVVRTITTTSQSAHYTAAQQTTDHGSVPASLNVCWHQMSEAVGRGFEGCATIGTFDPVEPIEGTGTAIYVLKGTIPGKPRAGFPVLIDPVSPEIVTFPENFVQSRGVIAPILGATATSDAEFSIQKNGVEIGTMTFEAASDEAVFASAADVLFDPSVDILTVVAPAVQDATLTHVGFAIAGIREGGSGGGSVVLGGGTVAPSHEHDSGAGPPAAGSVENIGHLYVDTTNSRIYFGVEIAGNFVDFGSLGIAFNQFTDPDGNASNATTTQKAFKFASSVNIKPTINLASDPDEVAHKIEISGAAAGDMIYFDGDDWVRLAAGTEGQVLTAHGAAPPTWETP